MILTHRQQVPVGLLHHIPVQGPLSRVEAFPLLWSELDVHILDGQLCLKWKHISLIGAKEDSYFHMKWEEVRGVRINSGNVIFWDPLKAIWNKLWVSNFQVVSKDYDIFQSIWICHLCGQHMKNIQIKFIQWVVYAEGYTVHTERHSLSRWVTARDCCLQRRQSPQWL